MPTMSIKELLKTISSFHSQKNSPFPSDKSSSWSMIKLSTGIKQIQAGDLLSLTFDEEDYPAKDILMGNQNLSRTHQDQHLIIVNKPEGMKTHANEPTELALLNHVSAYVGDLLCSSQTWQGDQWRCSLCQNPLSCLYSTAYWKTRISSEYWALVDGKFIEKAEYIRTKSVAIAMIGENGWLTTNMANTWKRTWLA